MSHSKFTVMLYNGLIVSDFQIKKKLKIKFILKVFV